MQFNVPTTNKPRIHFVKDQDPDNKSVRVFTNYETVSLQIWTGRRYAMVYLTLDEARSVAGNLTTCADDVWARLAMVRDQ